jgi:hypothetical protein
MVLAQRPGIVQRQVAAGAIGILIFVVIAPHRNSARSRDSEQWIPKYVGTRQNSGLHGCPVNRQLKIKGRVSSDRGVFVDINALTVADAFVLHLVNQRFYLRR